MKKFLSHEDKTVNLDAVTNIVIEQNKIIFNLDYAVSLRGETDKLIPDYVYFIYKDIQGFEDIKKVINNLNWIKSDFGSYDYHGNYRENNRIVNPEKISFVKYERFQPKEQDSRPKKFRVIFNIRTSISFRRFNEQMTSDFVYYDYTNEEDFNLESGLIKTQLNQY